MLDFYTFGLDPWAFEYESRKSNKARWPVSPGARAKRKKARKIARAARKVQRSRGK